MTEANQERIKNLPFQLKIALIIRINQRAVNSIKSFSSAYDRFQSIIDSMIEKFNNQDLSSLKSLEDIPKENRDICDNKRKAEMPRGAWMTQWQPEPRSNFSYLSAESISSEILWWSIGAISSIDLNSKNQSDSESLDWNISSFTEKYASSLFAVTMNESSRQRGESEIVSDLDNVVNYSENNTPEIYNYNEVFTKSNESKAGGGKSGCFIATATYGDYNHPNVVLFRNYRDNTLSYSFLGRLLIRAYYKYSPSISKYVEKSDNTKRFLKKIFNKIAMKIKNN